MATTTGMLLLWRRPKIIDSQPCYINSALTVDDNQSCFLNGEGITDNEPAYVVGHDSVTDNNPCYIAGVESVTDNQPSFINGWESITDGQSGFVNGEGISASNNCYISGYESVEAGQPEYLAGYDTVEDSEPCFIAAPASNIDSSNDCYINGRIYVIIGDGYGSVPYGGGVGISAASVINDQPAYIKGWESATDNQPSFTAGYQSITDGQPCFIVVIFAAEDTQLCHIRAEIFGEITSTTRLYIRGGGFFQSNSIFKPLYINGFLGTISSSKTAYIVSIGIIGDWRLDDGSFDIGTATANDYSDVGNDGAIVNWPTWVGGPIGKDC